MATDSDKDFIDYFPPNIQGVLGSRTQSQGTCQGSISHECARQPKVDRLDTTEVAHGLVKPGIIVAARDS